MTTMQQTADSAIGRRQATTTGRRNVLSPLTAVALAASLVGGIVGAAATAVAAQTIFNDQAAEQARLVQFAEQFKYALRWDDLQRQMYPYAR